jgi:hypothetical protein
MEIKNRDGKLKKPVFADSRQDPEAAQMLLDSAGNCDTGHFRGTRNEW